MDTVHWDLSSLTIRNLKVFPDLLERDLLS